MEKYDVVIIGGGLSGLAAARILHKKKCRVLLVEATSEVGGRVKTDKVDGFLLDHGFQVFQTSYPEARRVLNYSDLKLGKFKSGALVRVGNKFERVIDPTRHPGEFMSAFTNKVGGIGDKIRTLLVRIKLCKGKAEDVFSRPERTTMDYLQSVGFSTNMIERFYRPFLSGVFLESELKTSSRIFEFVFRMFSLGHATLPQNGMQAIPEHLATELPQEAIRLNSRVTRIENDRVELSCGERISTQAVLVATDAKDAHSLTKDIKELEYSKATCLYFKAPKAPISEPILVLNGNSGGVVNTFCVPSVICDSYAPEGQHLISITVMDHSDQESLPQKVCTEMKTWFGEQVDEWEHLKTYHIERAIPFLASGSDVSAKSGKTEDAVYYCGDYQDIPSINGAMISGRRAAEQILQDLQ